MRLHRTMTIAALAFGLAGCGKDVDDDDGPSIFGFSGQWVLLPDIAPVVEPCQVRLDDSEASASCQGHREYRNGTDEAYIQDVDLEAQGTLTETKVSLSGTWTSGFRFEYDGEVERKGCTVEFTGSADREHGRQSDGRFSALAGVWNGSASATAKCWRGSPDGPLDTDRFDFTFTADLYGTAGEVRWRRLGEPFEEVVVVTHTDGEGLRIANSPVPEGSVDAQ